MIPNKLYIPSTTLNFNNIMASESISPAGFYSARGFGYKRFDKVLPNNLDRRIILYDKYPIFDISDAELENYPIVIEIDSTYVSESLIHEYKNGIYYAEETIYFNPFFTKIYFRNEHEKRRTISKVEQSLNTKMMPIYQNCIFVENSNIESFKWAYTEVTDTTEDFAKYISKDRIINKLKGFLYAYLLGANKSLPHEIIVLKKYAKELQNILSSVITSSNSQASILQDVEIKALYQKINNYFHKAEGLDKKIENLITRKAELYNCMNFLDMLKKEELYDYWYQKQNLRPQYQIQAFNLSHSYKSTSDKSNNKYDSEKSVESQKYFNNYFTELEDAINRLTSYKNYSIDALPILQHCSRVASIPADKNGFLPKLFNEYYAENWNGEEFIASRLDFATVGGKLFKEELQENWENSPSKSYINNLRNNLASHTSFLLKSVDNLTLQSFAAFCKKGENDIYKLEDYLIANEIGDFRISFALWGIIFGFANMPKTLTNELFMSHDLNYITNVYKYIFKQIHGIELEGKFERKQEKTEFILSSVKISNQVKDEKTKSGTTKQQADKVETEYRVKLKQILKIEDFQINSIIEILRDNHFLINEKLFDLISRIDKLGKRTNIFKKVKDCLQSENLQIKKAPIDLSLFPNNIKADKEFYRDANVFNLVENLLPNDKKTKKQFKEDLDWFQGNYQEYFEDKKKGRQNGYYFGKPTDNSSVIEKFQDYLKNKKNSNQDWLRNIYYSVDSDQIIKELKKLYLQDER